MTIPLGDSVVGEDPKKPDMLDDNFQGLYELGVSAQPQVKGMVRSKESRRVSSESERASKFWTLDHLLPN